MHPLAQQIQSAWPLSVWGKTRVLVAVSGGADSVALLLALHSLSTNPDLLRAAHYNHRWRGVESDSDASFVTKLCEKLQIPLSVESASESGSVGSEADARRTRYDFLSRAAYASGCRYVVTAHTRSDRIETALHNLFRGTGLTGMVGPRRSRPFGAELVLARPLLNCFREDVLDYLTSMNQEFRSDSSNTDQRYRRNFIRHTILPAVRQQYGAAADTAIANFSEIADETVQLLSELAKEYLTKADELVKRDAVSRQTSDTFVLPAVEILPVRWPVLQTALQQCWSDLGWPLQSMTRQHWLLLRNFFQSSESEYPLIRHGPQLPGAVSVTYMRHYVEFRRQAD